MKENYQKALGTMNELHQIEIERLRMSCPVDYDELCEMFSIELINRYQGIYESYLKSGKVIISIIINIVKREILRTIDIRI